MSTSGRLSIASDSSRDDGNSEAWPWAFVCLGWIAGTVSVEEVLLLLAIAFVSEAAGAGTPASSSAHVSSFDKIFEDDAGHPAASA